MLYSEHLKKGKVNRQKFLAPYKAAFDKAETEKKKAEIIIELLKKKASLLSESWISLEVIKWMRSRQYKDYLQSAFIDETGREYRPTGKKHIEALKGFYLVEEINRLAAEWGSVTEACRQLVLLQDDPDTCHDIYPKRTEKTEEGLGFEDFIRKKYYKWKKVWNKPKFEFFYGENIYEIDGEVFIQSG